MIHKIFYVSILVFLTALPLFAVDFDLPEGNAITRTSLENVIRDVYLFIIWFASIATVATIIISGILWVTAHSEAQVDKAKEVFKAGIIGSVIILGAGVIINTIQYFVENVGDRSAGTRSTGGQCTRGAQCRSGICSNGRCTDR